MALTQKIEIKIRHMIPFFFSFYWCSYFQLRNTFKNVIYNSINLRWRADCDLNFQIDEFTTHFPFIHIITIRKQTGILGSEKDIPLVKRNISKTVENMVGITEVMTVRIMKVTEKLIKIKL